MMFKLSAYSENSCTVYRSVVLKNNCLGTVDKIFISNFNFLFFHFSDLRNIVKCMDSMFPCYSLLNMKAVWLYMVSALPPITMGQLFQSFVATKFFLTFMAG